MKNNDRMEDRIDVILAQLGDDDAFLKLVNRYHGRLLYYIRRLLDDADRADDTLQDIWLTVYKKIHKLRDVSAFSVWLYRIARNRAFRVLRDVGRYVLVDQYDESDWPEEEQDSLSFDDTEQLHHAITELTTEHREVIVLRFFEEMSYQEIADVMGCSVGTVRSRIHYAKQELRKKMEAKYNG